ncbi:hypothetical protein Sjap_024453 [Stephania japonica]|uniref:Uncharacterized protein n=1 Tax=Stephania japonica TaxID=461633 RepID=A0AAP0HNZ5_9MAGN
MGVEIHGGSSLIRLRCNAISNNELVHKIKVLVHNHVSPPPIHLSAHHFLH